VEGHRWTGEDAGQRPPVLTVPTHATCEEPGRLLVAVLAAWLLLRGRIDAVEVRGRSMLPGLRPGDRLIVVRTDAPQPGDVVLAPDPRDDRRELIKRVLAVGAAGVTVRGDNPDESTDARTFGAVPAISVRWRALLRYWPPDRLGRIRRS
jgi:nickel-type superoxide dismutase maturation protease